MDDISDRPSLVRGERLPDLRLVDARGGSPVPLVPAGGRQVPVIVLVDGADCEACRAYLRRLAEADAEMRAWDGRVVVVVPGTADEAARLADAVHPPFPVLADPVGALRQRLGATGAVVVVVDPWGEVRHRSDAGAAHDLPDPAELVGWARFVAIQCPECEGESL